MAHALHLEYKAFKTFGCLSLEDLQILTNLFGLYWIFQIWILGSLDLGDLSVYVVSGSIDLWILESSHHWTLKFFESSGSRQTFGDSKSSESRLSIDP